MLCFDHGLTFYFFSIFSQAQGRKAQGSTKGKKGGSTKEVNLTLQSNIAYIEESLGSLSFVTNLDGTSLMYILIIPNNPVTCLKQLFV